MKAMEKQFYSLSELSDIYGYSTKTVSRHVKDMRSLILLGVYTLRDFAGTKVRADAYQHYLNNRETLKWRPKSVTPFRA